MENEMSQAELSYRREVYRIGTRYVSQQDWNDWEWFTMRRITVDVSVPITDEYVFNTASWFRDQLN